MKPVGNPDSPYLTLDEGARFCRFDVTAPKNPLDAFRRWLHRQAVPIRRRGRTLLVEQAVLEAVLDGETRHGRQSVKRPSQAPVKEVQV